jgi:hypothetical protein
LIKKYKKKLKMKRGYTKSLITTASSKTNYLQRSVNSKIKVTCIYSNMNKSKNNYRTVIKSKSNKPINFKKSFYKISNEEKNKLDNFTVQNSLVKQKNNPQKLKILSIDWFKDIKNIKSNNNINNNNNTKTFSSNKKSLKTDIQVKKNNINQRNKNESLKDNNDTISNFLNYNLGEFNNEQDFEEDFFEKKLDPFIISLIDKKKKKNIKDEIKPENNVSEKEFDLSNCIKFKEEINNIKKEKGNRFDIHYEKRNISELTQNNSYYYSNTEELKPSEKIHSIYNSKFSLIKKT